MWEHRNNLYHSPTHPWCLAALSAIDVDISQEWQSYDSELYLLNGRIFFSGDLQFMLLNYSIKAKRKWLACIRTVRERKLSYQVSKPRVERAGMLSWLLN
jgi:hypothetical protein